MTFDNYKGRIFLVVMFSVLESFNFAGPNSLNKKNLTYQFPQNNQEKANKTIRLPAPGISGDVSVEEALFGRRSVRDFQDIPLDLKEISQILWAAYGVTENLRGGSGSFRDGLKTAPSAGALYPLELYLVSGNVSGLDPGIYKYKPENHSLTIIIQGDFRTELADAALNQQFIGQAPASIVYTAIYNRTTQKYGNRGKERYVCMDLGHSAQNVYLQAYTLGIGTCAVGAFTDKMVSMVIGLPSSEVPLYIMPLGKY